MPYSFRNVLPNVPDNNWNANTRTGAQDPETGLTTVAVRIDADTPTNAEMRALAYLDATYEDDLRRAIAVTQHQLRPGRYLVHVHVTDPWHATEPESRL